MRYFLGSVILAFLIAGCATTEPAEETGQTEPETVRPLVPEWYSNTVHSSSDSLSLHGYALASATDSLTAVELSTQKSLDYLRFEIDRTLEEIRRDLAESSDETAQYNAPSFIIELRNVVTNLPLTTAKFSRMHQVSDNGIHYSYSRATLLKLELLGLLENRLDDERMLQELDNLSSQ